MNNPRIENWSMTGGGDPYQPPECQNLSLQGKVYGHPSPRFEDGKFIRTSDIVKVVGSEVHTHSGSVYTLGEPKPAYVDWCRANDHHVPTPEEPIKLL
jgi:hypothetical protein